MNCASAKRLSIIGYLASIGIKPVYVKNNGAWYNSPFRDESKPSFKVDQNLNIWFDFGDGAGGNILDLVMRMNNTNVSGALLILQEPGLSKQPFSFSEQQKINQSGIKIKHIQLLQNNALTQYLNSRGISYSNAVNYIRECYYYSYPGQTKAFFALCWENIRDGYELHNAYRKKYSAGTKAPTIIKGQRPSANIFESMFDFLSGLEYFKIRKYNNTSIILNSVNNLGMILDTLNQYNQVNLFLDRDSAGNQAANKIKSVHSHVKDQSKLYNRHKDFNEFINYKSKKKPPSKRGQ